MSCIHPLPTKNSLIAVIYEVSSDTPYHGVPHYRGAHHNSRPVCLLTPHRVRSSDDAHSLTLARSPLRHRYPTSLVICPHLNQSSIKKRRSPPGSVLLESSAQHNVSWTMCKKEWSQVVSNLLIKLVELFAWNELKSWSQHIRVYSISVWYIARRVIGQSDVRSVNSQSLCKWNINLYWWNINKTMYSIV